jgi:hypothetical protein
LFSGSWRYLVVLPVLYAAFLIPEQAFYINGQIRRYMATGAIFGPVI